MFFSKSFGYAVRGILYVTVIHHSKQRVQVDEIAGELSVPRHFLSKIMKKVVKHGILDSTRGAHGGFSINDRTLTTSLFEIFTLTNSDAQFDNCVLGLKKCNSLRPCPLHNKIQPLKEEMLQLFTGMTIGELIDSGKQDLLKGISTI